MLRAIAVMSISIACGTARVLHVTQGGGTIELSGEHDAALVDARHEMAAHCGAGHYAITSDDPTPDHRSVTIRRVEYTCDAPIAH